ncbi:DEAD/DEAH box helicase [Mesorhizobium sp. M1076]|uniref:DEAD/DEAH box helicase n=1 Tax=Mesorhizobium sp. M1076 TaxID=2957054 RepID=UPI00333C686D
MQATSPSTTSKWERTTSLQPSAFDTLSEPVRRWIWQREWPSLRDVQEKAIPAILAGGDVVISARTAAGKTEAAFLPLLTRHAEHAGSADGFAILYVSPLKALINDQHRRLESLCEGSGVLLHKWHGDVSADAKARARKRPSGIVLITPESLEALLVRRGGEVAPMFSRLDAVVIDELHAFIGTERGMQLQSILNRIEVATARDSIDRIGLSATLGDMSLAAEALRPGKGASVTIVEGKDEGNGVRLQIRGYLLDGTALGDLTATTGDSDPSGTPAEPFEQSMVPAALAADLFRLLRGQSNLLFAGSRANVEVYADMLRSMCDEASFPNEFFPHHGNLARAMREEVEARLRDDPRPTTAVATTTLELGIDIGEVETIAQIGPGFSVASLRQRLGRSGRRAGRPATLRMFVIEPPIGKGRHPIDRLRLNLVQSIAMVECLRAGWCEPPLPAGPHLSTLLHQVMALIVQTGGVSPTGAWKLLCERGPFRAVDKTLFAELLRCMATPENQLIEQSPEGLLMIGETGEKITESHEFYAVFATEREYRIINDARTLGTYPLSSPLARGETIIFAGRRWQVIEIDDRARVIMVKPTRAGKPPHFNGKGAAIHDCVVATMRAVLTSDEAYPYLDPAANRLLDEARSSFLDLQLDRRSIITHGEGVLIFPWVGTRKLQTLTLALLAREFKASHFGHAIELQECEAGKAIETLQDIAGSPAPDGEELAARLAQPALAKFDTFLTDHLMTLVTMVERISAKDLPLIAAKALGNHTTHEVA